jgi:hypothetical protein
MYIKTYNYARAHANRQRHTPSNKSLCTWGFHSYFANVGVHNHEEEKETTCVCDREHSTDSEIIDGRPHNERAASQ